MAQYMGPVGVLGGTFDPVHQGHIAVARAALQSLQLAQVRLLPCHRPPHRSSPTLTTRQRLALLQLAIQEDPQLVVDDRELYRPGPSYTLDTLKSLRASLGGEVPLVFIMGLDAYLGLTSWYRWRQLLTYAHIAVLSRPGAGTLPQEGELAQYLCDTPRLNGNSLKYTDSGKPRDHSQSGLADAPRRPVQVLNQTPCGRIFQLEEAMPDVSATAIRQALADGRSPVGLAPLVEAYILQHGLYQ